MIFDMDGVLIDSEPLWRRAMIKGFQEFHITLTEEDCRRTTGSRFDEVVKFWLHYYNKTEISPKQVEDRITDILLELIANEGKAIEGVLSLLNYCKEKKLKVGLATSSSHKLLDAVLKKLNLEQSFDIAISAEYMKYGKPHPEVFLVCAEKLEVAPSECVIFEDSLNGVIAGKAAQMKVIAVPDEDNKDIPQLAVANYKALNMYEALTILESLMDEK